MPDILLEVPILAAPNNVYRAITEAEYLSRWLALGVVARSEVGAVAEFTFAGGVAGRPVLRVAIAELEPARAVAWTPREGTPDWEGTRIAWDLAPSEGGTRVRFSHRDFAAAEGSFARSGYSWAWYLASLKDYLETGWGRPGTWPA